MPFRGRHVKSINSYNVKFKDRGNPSYVTIKPKGFRRIKQPIQGFNNAHNRFRFSVLLLGCKSNSGVYGTGFTQSASLYGFKGFCCTDDNGPDGRPENCAVSWAMLDGWWSGPLHLHMLRGVTSAATGAKHLRLPGRSSA